MELFDWPVRSLKYRYTPKKFARRLYALKDFFPLFPNLFIESMEHVPSLFAVKIAPRQQNIHRKLKRDLHHILSFVYL